MKASETPESITWRGIVLERTETYADDDEEKQVADWESETTWVGQHQTSFQISIGLFRDPDYWCAGVRNDVLRYEYKNIGSKASAEEALDAAFALYVAYLRKELGPLLMLTEVAGPQR